MHAFPMGCVGLTMLIYIVCGVCFNWHDAYVATTTTTIMLQLIFSTTHSLLVYTHTHHSPRKVCLNLQSNVYNLALTFCD